MDTSTVFAFSAQATRKQLTVSISRFMRPQIRLFRLAGVLMIIFGLVFQVGDDDLVRIFGVLLGVAFAGVIPAMTVRSVVRKIEGMFSRRTDYRVDEQGVRMTNDLTDFFYRWAAVDRLDEAPGLLIARTGPSGFFALPIADLPEDEAAALADFVRGRVPA